MKIYLVGGAVRDQLLGLPVKERDYVVVGATVNDMLKLGYRQVGKEFPVFLHPKTGEEYALARAERKVKPGYKGFLFDVSEHVSLEEDLKRRDLTINAMAFDLEEKKIIDPFNGQKDIQDKILRHVSPAFAEDPVRILRVGRFLARFFQLGFHVHEETINLMIQMVKSGEVDALIAERVWKELSRALAQANPEMFFALLSKCHALAILFPPLAYDGPGIKALKESAKLSFAPVVRFAALLYASSKEEIAALCLRYRVPNAYRELALLIAQYYSKALHAQNLNDEELLKLLTKLDIFRREKRFEHFIECLMTIAHSEQINFNSTWLREVAKIVKQVDVKELIAQGFVGQQLALKLVEKRKEKISLWREQI